MTKIAILSDTHDNLHNLDIALQQIAASGAEVMLHCGDLCAPFIIPRLAESFAGLIHIIFGNNDGDGRLLQMQASRFAQVTLHGIYAELEISGRSLALIHYPEPARRIAQSSQFDVVCYGHNHLQNGETIGRCYLINPGEVLGMKGTPSWALYDCAQHTYRFQTIPT